MRVKHRAKQMQFQEFYGNMYDVNNGIDMLCELHLCWPCLKSSCSTEPSIEHQMPQTA